MIAAPTHPQRVVGNPLKEGGQRDSERSRMNKKRRFGSGHEASTPKQEQEEAERNKIGVTRGRHVQETVRETGGSKRASVRYILNKQEPPKEGWGHGAAVQKRPPAPIPSQTLHRSAEPSASQACSAPVFCCLPGPVSHSRFTDDRLMWLHKLELSPHRASEEARHMWKEAVDERVGEADIQVQAETATPKFRTDEIVMSLHNFYIILVKLNKCSDSKLITQRRSANTCILPLYIYSHVEFALTHVCGIPGSVQNSRNNPSTWILCPWRLQTGPRSRSTAGATHRLSWTTLKRAACCP